QRLYGSLAGHTSERDVVEGDRLVAPICQHRPTVFLDAVVPPLELIERGVELVRFDLDQEAEVSEVHPEDGDGSLRHESQRAEHRAITAETDQGVGLIGQLGCAHRLYGNVVWQSRRIPGVDDHPLAV